LDKFLLWFAGMLLPILFLLCSMFEAPIFQQEWVSGYIANIFCQSFCMAVTFRGWTRIKLHNVCNPWMIAVAFSAMCFLQRLSVLISMVLC
jgi:hypothetical protein